MSVTIGIGNRNDIFATIDKGSNDFDTVASFFRNHGCRYEPVTHLYSIPVKRYENIYDQLMDITLVNINADNKKKLSLLPTKVDNQIERYRNTISIEDLKVSPIKGKAPNFDYQFEDIQKLVSTNRHLLYNEMGTGKSYEVFSALDFYSKIGLRKVLILTSNSGTYNLKVDLVKFSDFNPDSIEIGDRNNRRPFDNIDTQVIICNYRSFLLISDEYEGNNSKSYRNSRIPISNWLDGDVGALILDESHLISNPKARQTKVVNMVSPNFYYIYLLSGTPADTEEKYYSQLRILDPALVKNLSYTDWSSEYFNVGDRYSEYTIGSIKPDKALELQSIIKPICTRRFSIDVLELPENYVRPYYVDFTDVHKELYKNVVKETLQKIKDAHGSLDARRVVSSFQTSILAIDNPELLLRSSSYSVELTRMINNFKFMHHSKVDALLDIVSKHDKSKIIIWTSHPSVSANIYEILFKKGYSSLVLNGETVIPKGHTRDSYKAEMISKFENEAYNILIAGMQVLNTSVTIVKSNVQIYYDTDFNFTNKNQSEKRIYRIGQKQDCYTYDLVIARSLDVVRYKNLQDKDFINRNFLTGAYIDLKQAQDIYNMEVEYEE